jgi:hypothetical protein
MLLKPNEQHYSSATQMPHGCPLDVQTPSGQNALIGHRLLFRKVSVNEVESLTHTRLRPAAHGLPIGVTEKMKSCGRFVGDPSLTGLWKTCP